MSVAKEQIAAKRTRRQRSLQPESAADWSKWDGTKLLEWVAIIAGKGGAVRLGYTRDGGAYAVGIYGLDSQPSTEYIRPGEDVEQFFKGLADDFRGM